MRRTIVILSTWIPIAALVAGCGKAERKAGDILEREGDPPVIYADDDDPKMLAAINKARSTVDQFIPALASPQPSQSGFSVKLPIKDGSHVEHMWVLPVQLKDGKFYGRINNDPDRVTTVKIGDEVSVAREEISDWMYLDNGKLIGGYSIRVLRDSMPANKRAEFERELPFSID